MNESQRTIAFVIIVGVSNKSGSVITGMVAQLHRTGCSTGSGFFNKAQILRFSTCEFIDAGHNIVLKGASGSGKSYIAQAIGNAACRKFKKVKYIRMPALLDELATAKATGEFRDTIKSYRNIHGSSGSTARYYPSHSSLSVIFMCRCGSGDIVICDG